MSWADACDKLRQDIVKIETPEGTGTGFFFGYNDDKSILAIATALHVVADAHEWRRPIKIRRVEEKEEVFLVFSERVVIMDYKRDSAAILISSDKLKAPDTMLQLVPANQYKRPGTRVMWGGYPGIAPNTLCFFDGSISAFNPHDDSYYLDGVAINGVSGGPVFDEDFEKRPSTIVGIVSAYFVNRQRGDTLPGFAVAHDVTHLHSIIANLKNLDEARKNEEAERKARELSGAGAGQKVEPPPAPQPKEPPPADASSDDPEAKPRKRRRQGLPPENG